jgi:CubicO group peptidase (beta-lactamase class C family)
MANTQILSPASWKQALTPGLDKYGFGWWIDSLFNRKYIYHSGGLPGFMSYLVYFPDDDITIIMLTNFGNYGDGLAPMNAGLSAIVFGQPYTLWEKHDAINVDKDDLKHLAGAYRVNEKHSLIITFKKDKLYVEAVNPKDRLPQVQLYAETESKFYIKEAQLKFEFVKDNNGNPVKLITYNSSGKDAEWVKVK